MTTINTNTDFKKIATFGGGIGAIGGFIADVLTPLAPFSEILSVIFLSVGVLLLIFIKNDKVKFGTKTNSITAFISGLIFLALSLAADDDKGLLASHVPAIQGLQESLNIVSEKLDAIDEKVDSGFESMETNFDNLESLIKANNPIDNPSSASDFIVNAYLFMQSGNEKKSLNSFEEFLKLSEVEKIDVYKDYYSVCVSVEGKSEASNKLKSFNSKLADLVLIDETEETLDGYLSRIQELELNDELLCIAYRMNLMSSRRVNNGTSKGSYKSSIMAYSACSKFSVEEDYTDFEFLFLNKTKIPDYWAGGSIPGGSAENTLKSMLKYLTTAGPTLDDVMKGQLVEVMFTGSAGRNIYDKDNITQTTGFEKNESEEFIEYLDRWKQYCKDNDVEWTYN